MFEEKKISIDIHGFRAIDAKIAIEDHIIECINQNYSQIRIVHGHGTGVLKKITEEVLSSSKFVKDFIDFKNLKDVILLAHSILRPPRRPES